MFFFLFKKGTFLLNSPLQECSENSVSYCAKHTKTHMCSSHGSCLETGVQLPAALSLIGWAGEVAAAASTQGDDSRGTA